MFGFLISDFVLKFLPWLIFGLILFAFLGLQIAQPFWRKAKRAGFFTPRFIGSGILILLAVRLIQTGLEFYGQYYLWLNNELTKFLLPPHTPISYFWGYGWLRFFKGDVFAIAVAAGLFFAIILLNRFFEERFFYKEEPYLAALGALAIGWPNWILFLGLVLIPGVLFHLGRLAYPLILNIWHFVSGIFLKIPKTKYQIPDTRYQIKTFRLSFLYFWLPAAIAVYFWGAKLAQIVGLGQFRI